MTGRPGRFLSVFLVLVLAVAAFFYRNEFLSYLGVIRSFDYEELEVLELDNMALRVELNELREKTETVLDSYVRAKVYSRYPFNDRRLLIVNLGEVDGISEGMPVLFREGVLLGKVKSVFKRQSLIETVFDPEWRSSAVIGSLKARTLIEGGNVPALTFIEKDSEISEGDPVLNTSPEFPLNLLLGELSEVEPVSEDVWLTAKLNTVYDLEKITEVLIITNFP